jgi:hypothetical protein
MPRRGRDIEHAESDTKDYLWGYVEAGEEFVEGYAEAGLKKLGKDDIPIIKAGSLAMLAWGIRSYKEFLFGSVALALYYWMSSDDSATLDGAVTALAGVQFARGQYLTASFPTLVETYASFRDWKVGKFATKKQILKLAIYVTGFYLGLKKMV